MEKIRYYTLDVIRGFTLIHMIAYHTLWDIVNLFEKRLEMVLGNSR